MYIQKNISKKVLLVSAFLLSSCSEYIKNEPLTSFEKVGWENLFDLSSDDFKQSKIAFEKSCQKLLKQPPQKVVHGNRIFGVYGDWHRVCEKIKNKQELNALFFKNNFQPYQVKAEKEGLFTGYYSPVLKGSLKPSKNFTSPLYGKPQDLYTADLGVFDPTLKGYKIVARVDGQKLKPYFKRQEIKKSRALNPLLFLENQTENFFLHVQGSGLVELPDGEIVKVSYAGHNGHAYKSIGRTLIHKKWMKKEEVSLQSIQKWLENNPKRRDIILNSNPRYIFFSMSSDNLDIQGSLGVSLTAERSLAVDPKTIPLGVPLFVNTKLTGATNQNFQRLMFAQDTGAAIKGRARGDIYFGIGEKARKLAGAQNAKGDLYVLVPKK